MILLPPGPDQQSGLLDLVCLAPAGAGASYFWGWRAKLPATVRLLPVELPGRNGRSGKESLRTDLVALAEEVAQAMLSFRNAGCERAPPKLAVFGHSLGAWLGFELVLALERKGVEVVKLYASAARAPSLAVGGEQDPLGNISALPPDQFWPRFEARYGRNPVLASPAIRAHVLPVLVADLTLTESYRGSDEKVRCQLAAIGVRGDNRHTAAQLCAWRDHAAAEFEELWFSPPPQPAWATPHRWLADDPSALLSWLAEDLKGR